ncbi:MAG: hypothetical protein WC789_10550 [Lentisphaeria bacterium]
MLLRAFVFIALWFIAAATVGPVGPDPLPADADVSAEWDCIDALPCSADWSGIWED